MSTVGIAIAPHLVRQNRQDIQTREIAEGEVIRLAAKGNAEAFALLYRRHSNRVYGLCLRMIGNAEEAEDVTQEAFMQVFRKIGTFRGEASFSTWLHRLTVNAVLMRLRKKRRVEISIDDATRCNEQDPLPPPQLSTQDLNLQGVFDRVNLGKAIEELPDGYRQIFILHDVEGYEHNEIATLLGCSIGNSKSQLFKARQKLRWLLRHHLNHDRQKETQASPVNIRTSS
jgi:RNA polymerase sigma-70 factor (ECF subfamily)